MKQMKAEIISVKKENKKVQKDLDDLKDSNRQIIRQINDMNPGGISTVVNGRE
jgi:cell division protein FtsB